MDFPSFHIKNVIEFVDNWSIKTGFEKVVICDCSFCGQNALAQAKEWHLEMEGKFGGKMKDKFEWKSRPDDCWVCIVRLGRKMGNDEGSESLVSEVMLCVYSDGYVEPLSSPKSCGWDPEI